MENLNTQNKPLFSWYPIFFHWILATIIAWITVPIIENNPIIADVIKLFFSEISFLIPSIAGNAAISPNHIWAKIYLLVCWLGAPFYISFFWRLSEFVLPAWVEKQKSFHFWVGILINLSGVFAILVLPNEHSLPKDATESIRVVATVVSLMKESYMVFSIMGIAIIVTFSFMFAASLKAIQLRLTKDRRI